MSEELLSQVSADENEKNPTIVRCCCFFFLHQKVAVLIRLTFEWREAFCSVAVDVQLVSQVFITTVHNNTGDHPVSANHL